MSLTPFNHNANHLKKSAEADLLLAAAEEVLEKLFGVEAKHISPLFLKNRTLTVSCSTLAIAQVVREHQGDIVGKINDKLGKKEVDRIRYLL